MVKTRFDKSAETIEKLQLKLIEVEAMIRNPVHEDPFTLLTHGLRKLEHERTVIREKLSFLISKREAEEKVEALATKKPRQTKQEIIYKKIERMAKRRPQASKVALCEALAQEMGLEESNRIRKAYYDQQAKLKRERDAKARQKRDSEVNSAQRDQQEK